MTEHFETKDPAIGRAADRDREMARRMPPHEARAFDDASEQAYQALHATYALLPVLAGADKFLNVFVDWEEYLSPQYEAMMPGRAPGIMKAVGVTEMAAGVLTAVNPRVGGYVVGAWLGGIVLNYAVGRRFGDIALRDVGLMVGAFALGRMAEARHRAHAQRQQAGW